MRYLTAAALCALFGARAVPAQTPDTDIYLAPLRIVDGWVAIGVPVNITNRPGYDNQPQFSVNGRTLLFTARMDDGQTDIFEYDLRTRKTTRLTNTPESEYSATPLRNGFSVVRVEPDSAQRLWWFDRMGKNPTLLVDVKPVGYHAWINDQQAALFVLGSPATLQLADLRSREATVVAHQVGRALQKIPNWNGVSFVQHESDSTMWIRRIDGRQHETRAIAQLLPGGEYHAWTPRSALLATAGSKLYEWTPIDGGTWRQVFDAAPLGLLVSRIAVSPRGDMIALVGERAATR
jgi:hypothetical protein